MQIREIALTRVRYGNRRVRVLLNREDWNVGRGLMYLAVRRTGPGAEEAAAAPEEGYAAFPRTPFSAGGPQPIVRLVGGVRRRSVGTAGHSSAGGPPDWSGAMPRCRVFEAPGRRAYARGSVTRPRPSVSGKDSCEQALALLLEEFAVAGIDEDRGLAGGDGGAPVDAPGGPRRWGIATSSPVF